jgi:alpha-ketoglutarate-dependent taurine dioxygenase
MQIRPLHSDIGAEVLDFDLHLAASELEIEQLRAALDEYQLLLVRGKEPIVPDRQVEINSWFGTPADNGSGRLWTVLQNEEVAGSINSPLKNPKKVD